MVIPFTTKNIIVSSVRKNNYDSEDQWRETGTTICICSTALSNDVMTRQQLLFLQGEEESDYYTSQTDIIKQQFDLKKMRQPHQTDGEKDTLIPAYQHNTCPDSLRINHYPTHTPAPSLQMKICFIEIDGSRTHNVIQAFSNILIMTHLLI